MGRPQELRRRMLNWFLLLALVYVGLCTLVYLAQDRLIFVGAGARGAPLPGGRDVDVRWATLPSGERFRLAVAEASDAKGVIVFFVGNGEDLRSGFGWARLWRDYGLCSVVAEYPGYGDSEGSPSKVSVLAAADAAAEVARDLARSRGVPLLVGGSSLGSCPAVHLAAHGEFERLILRAPMTSLAEAGQSRFFFLPIGLLLRHDFDNVALADRVRCPVLVIHGDRDSVLPHHMGEELAARFAGETRFVTAKGYGHNSLPLDRDGPFGTTVAEFVRGQ